MIVERIFVQLADRPWTLESTHLACQIARVSNAEIIFVKMVAVQHVGWLGTELGYCTFTPNDHADLRDYASTAEDYGVAGSIQLFQYMTFVEGVCEAARHFETQLVFATSLNPMAFMRRLQNQALRQRLAHYNSQMAERSVIRSVLDYMPMEVSEYYRTR